MRCPYCNQPESKVIDSRPTEESNSIRRRRECLGCGKRFTTYETVENVPLVVVKKDGSRQSFDRQKILAGTPMGRFGKTEDLAGGLLFLLDDNAAGFITGVVLPIDGGFSAYSGV